MLAKKPAQLCFSLGALFTLSFLLFGQRIYRAPWLLPVPHSQEHDEEKGISHGGDQLVDMSVTHQVLRSASSADGAYFHIDFGSRRAINPSIIPHPEDNTTWIVTAQLHESHEERGKDRPRLWFAELVCTAAFVTPLDSRSKGQTLRCIDPPLILPIAATPSDSSKCTGDQAFFTLSIGPHDARVFHGPDAPYTVYGSTSQLTCFGQWMLDFRLLVDWGLDTVLHHQGSFRQPTELQRPLLTPYRSVEKNWFVFWDAAAAAGEQSQGHSYVHYDIAPTRSFAQLLEPADGSVGPDLAPQAAQNDDACLQRLLPALPDTILLDGSGDAESIHQATNALSITLCARADPFCVPGDENTFVLSIFQHKSFYNLHSTYEPYAMLFRARAPFEVYGVSRKPLWIHGRRTPPLRQSSQWQQGSSSPMYGDNVNDDDDDEEEEEEMMRAVKLESEMMYVTSISWKAHGQGYHGFVDDVLFIGFGIEDSATGGIDVRAGDLVDGLALCV